MGKPSGMLPVKKRHLERAFKEKINVLRRAFRMKKAITEARRPQLMYRPNEKGSTRGQP